MKESVPNKIIHAPGTLENPIIDAQMTEAEALRPNPDFPVSQEIFKKQVLVPVVYLSFDKKYHQGQIVVDRELEADARDFFNFLLELKFPLSKAIPIAHSKYNFDDNLSMADNNSSGFNPRFIAGTKKFSLHALGRAIDINPFQNPYIRGSLTEPVSAIYNAERYGTITPEIAEFLRKRGWRWGGIDFSDPNFPDFRDYQHFEKLPGEDKES